SRSGPKQLFIGPQPLVIPTDVEFTHEASPHRPGDVRFRDTTQVRLKGPMGELLYPIPSFMTITECPLTEDDKALNRRRVSLGIRDESQTPQRAMWGTTRTVIQNMITGVGEGYTVPLRLVGVGFRATLEPLPAAVTTAAEPVQLSMKLGFSHPIIMPVPPGITVTTPNPTRILLKGADWQQLKLFAATIRAKRKPEPYNQKGIFVGDETIKKKEGKKK
ncbi:mitochondrial 54S ribosomal protein YmL16, partial [Dimargaris cristalligena]